MTGADATRVAFVGHDASRTGAPMVLLALLRWLSEHRPDIRFSTVLAAAGPLVADYRSLGPCMVLASRIGDGAGTVNAGLRSVGLPPVVPDPARALRLRNGPHADVVVANTLAALDPARSVVRRTRSDSRLVCHVHELDGVAARILPAVPSRRRAVLSSVDHFVAAGRPVRDMLVERLGVPSASVSVIDEFIDPPSPDPAVVLRVGRELRADRSGPIVLDVGAMNRRKGPERFVDLMAMLGGRTDAPIGVWLGGDAASVVWGETVGDVQRCGVGESIRLIPTVEDPAAYLAAADVVVSTAIEDPYPLAVLEAAALGVPVVGFDSGGLVEVLRGAGMPEAVVGVGDLLAMRDRVAGLLDDGPARGAAGDALARWVRATHLTEHLAPALWAAIAP